MTSKTLPQRAWQIEQRLLAAYQKWLLEWRLLVAAATIGSIVAAIWLSGSVLAEFRKDRGELIRCFAIVIAGFVTILYFNRQAERIKSIFRSPIASVEGTVSLNITGGIEGLKPRIAIHNMHFYVPMTVFLAFKNGDPYRIYYAPGSNTILSAEWLRGE